MLFAKLNTSNMVVDFDFKRFVFKYFWVPGMFGILVLNFTSCAENYDPATRLLPISVLFSPAGENSAEIYRLRTWSCRTKRKKREVLCNLVRGHNRYLVSAQQESAGGRDFLARASNLAEPDIAK